MMTIMIAFGATALPLEAPVRVQLGAPRQGCKAYFRRMSSGIRPASSYPCFQMASAPSPRRGEGWGEGAVRA